MSRFFPLLYRLIFIHFCLYVITFAQQDTITVEKCIQIALEKNPQLKIAQANLDYYTSSTTITRSAIFPQLFLQSGYVKNGGTFFIGPTARAGNYENYSYGFQLQQLIFDFGKTYSRISASSDLEESSRQEYNSSKQDLIVAVDIAYMNYLQAKRLKAINEGVLSQADEHLKQAEGFYKAGSRPQYDVLVARTDYENANLNLIRSTNDVRIARIQLENLINEKFPDDTPFRDNLEAENEAIDLESAKKQAEETRPELISAKFKVEASKSLLTSAWTANLPSVNASAVYQWRSFQLNQTFQNSWNLGLTFSLPLFQGFSLDAGIDQARANLKISEGVLETTQQSVSLDVEQNYYNVLESKESIESSKILVEQAQEAFRLANARYKEGVGSPIEISDAQVTLLNAKNSYVQSLFTYQLAQIRLKRAIGTL
jgi:outer membrane protein